MPFERLRFDNPADLAEALASFVADALERDIAAHGTASLAVSGGSTPIRFFAALAQADVDWPRVVVTLVDERIVDEASPRSNAGLVRNHLLVGRAAAAKFAPLCSGERDPEQAALAGEARIGNVPRPFAAVILGMGVDGHTASWFAGGDRLGEATDPDCPRAVLAIRAPSVPEPRVTVTLPCVLDTHHIVLHIEGEAKRVALEQALAQGPALDMPVRAVLRQSGVPVTIFWCA